MLSALRLPALGFLALLFSCERGGGTAGGGGFIPPPAATSIVTGVVLATDGAPLAGVQAFIRGTQVFTTTDARGQFRLTQVPVGRRHLEIIGPTALDPRTLPCLVFEILVEEGVDSGLRRPVYLPPLDMARAVTPALNGEGVVLTDVFVLSAPLDDGTTGMILEIPQGTRVTFADGVPAPISLTPVPTNRVPMALTDGLGSTSYYTIQPADVHFDPPAPVRYANVTGLAPGTEVEMMSFDHGIGRYVSRGPGAVMGDGRFIRSLPGGGVTKGGWHAPGFRVEPIVVEGAVEDCDGMAAFHRAAATARQARADSQNAMHGLLTRASDLVQGYVKGKVKSRVKKWLQNQALAAAGFAESGGIVTAILEIKSAIEAIDGFFEDVTDATFLIDDVIRDVGVYVELARIADRTNEQARQAAAAINPLACLAQTQALHAKATALFDAADLQSQIASMEDERGVLRDEQGNLLSYVEAAKLARAKLQQIVDDPPTTLQQARLAALTLADAVALLEEAGGTGDQIDGDLDDTAEELDDQLQRFAEIRADNAAYIAEVGALFQGVAGPVPAEDGAPTQVGTTAVISRVAGVSVLAGGVTGFTDAKGRFLLRGVPGIQVNLGDQSRTPLPVTVDLDDSALDGLRPDTDGDAIPDDWEDVHGLDRLDPDDALLDIDGDGLTALAEYAAHSDPRVADSDGDGVSDFDEVAAGGDPALAPSADPPLLYTVSPNTGRPGQAVSLRGTGFGGDATAAFVTFDGIPATVTFASHWRIDLLVPDGVRTGPVVVSVKGKASNGVKFTAGAEARNLSECPTQESASPCIALGADERNVYVAWRREDGAAVVLRRSTDGGGNFGVRETLGDAFAEPLTTEARVGPPWLATGPDGSVAAVWSQWRRTAGAEFAEFMIALAPDGGVFGAPRRLAVPPTGAPPGSLGGVDLRMALDGSGGFHAVFHLNQQLDGRVFATRSLDGGATFDSWRVLSAPPNAGAGTYALMSGTSVVVAGDGSVTVAWVEDIFSTVFGRVAGADRTRHSSDRGATFGDAGMILSDVLGLGTSAHLRLGADGTRVYALQTLGCCFWDATAMLTVSTDSGATLTALPLDVMKPASKSESAELGVGAGGRVTALLVVAGSQIVARRSLSGGQAFEFGPGVPLPVSPGGQIAMRAGSVRISATGVHHVVWTDVFGGGTGRDVYYVGAGFP